MAEAATKSPVKTPSTATPPAPARTWHPFESFRHEMARLMHEFDGSWMVPYGKGAFAISPWQRDSAFAGNTPAVDIIEKDTAFEITAELPGMDEKDVEVNLSNGSLTIRGEKQESKEEKKKDYYLQERHFGCFERAFRVPESVDAGMIEAVFKNGVLTVTMPKTAAAKQAEKKIAVKAA